MNNIVEGNPTKTFFIEMITRDISIKDAILDLLDNSIDGANKINSESYNGLFIDITINRDEFCVKDNCGGFSLEIAKKYAFRFGRPDDAVESIGSIGRFGIGMKRALFKMGKNFEVESKTDSDHFEINVDVSNWRTKKTTVKLDDDTDKEIEDWDFTYQNITAATSNLDANGTFVSVKNLYNEVSELFGEDSFLVGLRDDIERLLNFSLEKGIRITLNEQELYAKNIKIFNDDSTPFFYEGSKDGVNIRVIAGLGEVGTPSASGWYIYCNNRLVVEGDRTEITGWGTSGIAKWHIDYVMFRGILFLDAIETIKLPLTTTKKGIDATSDIYKTALGVMREAMQNVIPFLKQITQLGSDANDYRKLLGEQEAKITVVEMKAKDLTLLPKRMFKAPEINEEILAEKNDNVRISYSVKKELANLVKYHSDTKSNKEVGEYTFKYYLKMEDLENE